MRKLKKRRRQTSDDSVVDVSRVWGYLVLIVEFMLKTFEM